MKKLVALILLGFTQLGYAAIDPRLEQVQELRLAGNYPAAIERVQNELAAAPNDSLLLNELGELRLETGDLDAAATRLREALELPGAGRLLAQLNLAEVHRQRGEWQQAESLWREIRQAYQTAPSLSARDLFAIASATRHLGRSDPQLFKDAVRLYDQASRKDPAYLDAGIALGELLLEKYNNEEASVLFKELLTIDDKDPRALLGLARSQHFDYSSEAVATALRALSLNPNLVPTRVFMARLFIELEEYGDARREAELALEINPVSLEALALLGVIDHLERNPGQFAAIEQRVLALNPRYADFYATLAELVAQNRLYRDAEKFAQRAVQLDPQSWRGYGLLGINQLRLGQIEAGRASLERSFAGDPYNAWIKNTLQLADTFNDYVQTGQSHFSVVLHRDEHALLEPYIHDLVEQAYQQLQKRYRHQPDEPIRVELYPDHADFSVRSVGQAGVGLLGVCFGPVVAMDSPAARARGEFNWGSTLWHELAHVFHLSMSGNRVPRWFSEGLAVYEERKARPGWGGDVSPDFLLAYLDGRLLPVSQLDNGFVRPSYPDQVIHSYFQASLVFEFIEQRWGFDVIRTSLNAYRDSKDPDAVLLQQLQIDSAELDTAFDDYLQTRYATALAALRKDADANAQDAPTQPSQPPNVETALPDKYFEQLELGQLLFDQDQLELAESFLQRAQQLFPEYAGNDSSYWFLATLYLRQENYAQAEAQLEQLIAINAEHYPALLELAKLRAKRGDNAAAAAALERAIYIYPYEIELHQELAGYQASLGNWDQVARARRALLALDPVDRAEAFYQLALAYERAGNRSSAHEQILYALEIAPNFQRAQELLLALRASTPAAMELQ
ncbi:MAG: tetratricopeptide repeat protein [Gammaproteobacteria bacterium]|jgi:tetratricopeptide (TPR) repeat protein|nr:tetratricopeptide repeat protein [Gammaproteobacteria bacterium]